MSINELKEKIANSGRDVQLVSLGYLLSLISPVQIRLDFPYGIIESYGFPFPMIVKGVPIYSYRTDSATFWSFSPIILAINTLIWIIAGAIIIGAYRKWVRSEVDNQ